MSNSKQILIINQPALGTTSSSTQTTIAATASPQSTGRSALWTPPPAASRCDGRACTAWLRRKKRCWAVWTGWRRQDRPTRWLSLACRELPLMHVGVGSRRSQSGHWHCGAGFGIALPPRRRALWQRWPGPLVPERLCLSAAVRSGR